MSDDPIPHQDDPQPSQPGPTKPQASMADVVRGDFDAGPHRPPETPQTDTGVYWDFDTNPNTQNSRPTQQPAAETTSTSTPADPQNEVPPMDPELEQTVQNTPSTPSALPESFFLTPPVKTKSTSSALENSNSPSTSQTPTNPTTNESSPKMGERVKKFTADQKYFDRYALKKVLGKGGMGIVWLAHDEKLEREVALKFLPEVVHLDSSLHDALKQETKKSLELTHPNILRIYDFIEDSETAAISMEYVDGPTLSKLRTEKPKKIFEITDISFWIKQMCSALDYAHSECKVVHRDLKPANIMINSKGQIKIADFGIARSLSDSMSQITQKKGASSGTLPYMSPQQLMGEQPAVSGDIYSLAATIYELLTSRPPFYSGDVASQVIGKVPPSMKDRQQELKIQGDPIPQNWEETIAACLSKDAAKRPLSAGIVADRLGLTNLKGPRDSQIEFASKVVLPASHRPSFSIKKDAHFSATTTTSTEETPKSASPIPQNLKNPINPIKKIEPITLSPQKKSPQTPAEIPPAVTSPAASLPALPDTATPPAKKSSGKKILRDAIILILLVGGYSGYLLYGKGKMSSLFKPKKQSTTQAAPAVKTETPSSTIPKTSPTVSAPTPSTPTPAPTPPASTISQKAAPVPIKLQAPTPTLSPPPSPTPNKPTPPKPNVNFKLLINGISIFGTDATATLQNGQILEIGGTYSYIDPDTQTHLQYKVLNINETSLVALYNGKEYTFKPHGSDIGKFEEKE